MLITPEPEVCNVKFESDVGTKVYLSIKVF